MKRYISIQEIDNGVIYSVTNEGQPAARQRWAPDLETAFKELREEPASEIAVNEQGEERAAPEAFVRDRPVMDTSSRFGQEVDNAEGVAEK